MGGHPYLQLSLAQAVWSYTHFKEDVKVKISANAHREREADVHEGVQYTHRQTAWVGGTFPICLSGGARPTMTRYAREKGRPKKLIVWARTHL